MKSEQLTGKHGQNVAASALTRLGIEMVEQIGTPMKLIPVTLAFTKRNIYRVIFGEKVSGDHRGVLFGGRSVLAETKTILDRNLRYSDLREHQPGRLSSHATFGGLSLLVWVHNTGVYIMEWPIEGFVEGKSISPEKARELNIESLESTSTRRVPCTCGMDDGLHEWDCAISSANRKHELE
jgi:hypothetical protein